ncbi:spore protein [Shouchella shacheensis]|nr:spore protein [Shouchella shacheensis]
MAKKRGNKGENKKPENESRYTGDKKLGGPDRPST